MLLSVTDSIQNLLSNFSVLKFLQFTLVLAGAAFVLGIVLRFILGKGSNLNKSVGAAFGILMIYIISVAINIQNHYEIFLNPLPFVSISGDHLTVFNLIGAPINDICAELVKMIFLAFCVGIIQELLPEGKNFFVWYLLRCLVVVGSMLVHWGLTLLLDKHFPEFLTYANVTLLILAIALLATTAFKWIVGGILGIAVSPIIGAIYGFVVGTVVGKKLLQAILTTVLLTLLVYILNVSGVTVLLTLSAGIATLLPALLMIVIVWYLFSKFL
jgi:hypothetical protein